MDWVTILALGLGFTLQPILYELSPLPDIVERIKKRKHKANWWERLWQRAK